MKVENSTLVSKPTSKPVPTTPPMDPAVRRQRFGWLHWIRVGFGALAGLLSGVLGLLTPVSVSAWNELTNNSANPNAYYALYIAVFVYIVSYYVAKYTIFQNIDPKDRNKLFTQGIGSYIMMFFFVWILFNTYNYCSMFGACHI